MKKLITAILMASVLASTPALAQDRSGRDFPGSYREWQRDGDRWDRQDRWDRRDRRDRRRGPSTGGVVAAILGGVILGAVIADDRNHRRFRDDRRWRDDRGDRQVFRDDDYCYTEVYSNQYGDTYSRQICR
jgi:Ni/Co efflux regulator RcnB